MLWSILAHHKIQIALCKNMRNGLDFGANEWVNDWTILLTFLFGCCQPAKCTNNIFRKKTHLRKGHGGKGKVKIGMGKGKSGFTWKCEEWKRRMGLHTLPFTSYSRILFPTFLWRKCAEYKKGERKHREEIIALWVNCENETIQGKMNWWKKGKNHPRMSIILEWDDYRWKEVEFGAHTPEGEGNEWEGKRAKFGKGNGQIALMGILTYLMASLLVHFQWIHSKP